MRPVHCILLLGLLAGACEKTTTTGPGGTQLTLNQPADQTLTRGSTNEIAISIDREGFTGPVDVQFELPRGVHVVENKPIPASDERTVYTLHAANDADLVEKHQARVTARGAGGIAATQTFLITVKTQE